MFLTYEHPAAVKAFLGTMNVKPDICGLARLTCAFLEFPYENLTKIIRASTAATPDERYRLPDIIVEEYQEYGAGGTCFSLTCFFETVLKTVGFDCYSVMVDRSYGRDTHCALIVRLHGEKYLVDPGYCLSSPIPITGKETAHRLPHNTYIISPAGNGNYTVATERSGLRKARYLLKDRPVAPAEFLKHWDASFGWPMMRHLCVTRLSEDGYLYLRDRHLRHTGRAGKRQENIGAFYDKKVAEAFKMSQKIVSLASNIIMEKRG